VVVNRRPRTAQRGLTLIELMVASIIGAILLGALHSLVKLGLDAQGSGRSGNELAYQGRFALARISNRANSTLPKLLSTPAAGSTGNWFAPSGCSGAACVMYCRNAASQLIETSSSDTVCSGSTVIANQVSAFAATLPAGMGPLERPRGQLSLSLSDGSSSLNLVTSVRLGGGTQ
jgi:prepilin-type N-terminal cleavage/methylation domain-containing protein